MQGINKIQENCHMKIWSDTEYCPAVAFDMPTQNVNLVIISTYKLTYQHQL